MLESSKYIYYTPLACLSAPLDPEHAHPPIGPLNVADIADMDVQRDEGRMPERGAQGQAFHMALWSLPGYPNASLSPGSHSLPGFAYGLLELAGFAVQKLQSTVGHRCPNYQGRGMSGERSS